MRLPWVRVTVRRMAVAVALLTGLAAVHSQILLAPEPVYVAVSASVAGLFILGGMRHPWLFLVVTVALEIVLPRVSDSSAHDLFKGCYVLGWAFGSLAGWVIRSFSKGRTVS